MFILLYIMRKSINYYNSNYEYDVEWHHHDKAVEEVQVPSSNTLTGPRTMMIVALNANITILTVVRVFFLR